jgi:hypothetical protein
MAEQPSAGTTFEFQGKTYFLPPVSQDVKREFAALSGAVALDRVRALAPFQSREQNGRDYDIAMQMVMAGRFEWEEPAGIAYRYTQDGMARLCWLCVRSRDPAAAFDDVRAAGEQEDGEFLHRHYRVANTNPTVPPPSPVAAG